MELYYQSYFVYYLTRRQQLTCTTPSALITECAEREYCLKPATIIVDFESAVHNVVRTLFPASSLKGCLCHFGQALWSKLHELGLSAKYGKEDYCYDNEDSKWFRLFIGTAFVPPPQVMTAYQLITSTYTPDDRRCIKYNDYFMNTRLSGNYPIAM